MRLGRSLGLKGTHCCLHVQGGGSPTGAARGPCPPATAQRLTRLRISRARVRARVHGCACVLLIVRVYVCAWAGQQMKGTLAKGRPYLSAPPPGWGRSGRQPLASPARAPLPRFPSASASVTHQSGAGGRARSLPGSPFLAPSAACRGMNKRPVTHQLECPPWCQGPRGRESSGCRAGCADSVCDIREVGGHSAPGTPQCCLGRGPPCVSRVSGPPHSVRTGTPRPQTTLVRDLSTQPTANTPSGSGRG